MIFRLKLSFFWLQQNFFKLPFVSKLSICYQKPSDLNHDNCPSYLLAIVPIRFTKYQLHIFCSDLAIIAISYSLVYVSQPSCLFHRMYQWACWPTGLLTVFAISKPFGLCWYLYKWEMRISSWNWWGMFPFESRMVKLMMVSNASWIFSTLLLSGNDGCI